MDIRDIEFEEEELAQDSAAARAYDARKAAGLLTPEEEEAIPLEQAFAEIEGERSE